MKNMCFWRRAAAEILFFYKNRVCGEITFFERNGGSGGEIDVEKSVAAAPPSHMVTIFAVKKFARDRARLCADGACSPATCVCVLRSKHIRVHAFFKASIPIFCFRK